MNLRQRIYAFLDLKELLIADRDNVEAEIRKLKKKKTSLDKDIRELTFVKISRKVDVCVGEVKEVARIRRYDKGVSL